jgi:hypothetical protein
MGSGQARGWSGDFPAPRWVFSSAESPEDYWFGWFFERLDLLENYDVIEHLNELSPAPSDQHDSRRKVTTIALAVSIMSLGVKSVLAQPGSQPDVRMLLNLDLFTAQPNAPASGDDDSTLHQIQALRAMGHLDGVGNGSPKRPLSTTNCGRSEMQPTTGGRGGEVE